MARRSVLICLIGLGLLSVSGLALAQQDADRLSGYWKKIGESVYMKIVNTNGVYEAEMVRNDWSPELVGSSIFSDATQVGNRSNRWEGVAGADPSGSAKMRITPSGELTIRLRPGGRSKWEQSEHVEKRR